jgi:type II secretory pathway pseudopilin PulG
LSYAENINGSAKSTCKDNMQHQNGKFRNCPALTIVEIIIALAIITIIFAAVLPQFRVILKGWDSRQANTEVLQNGRVLIDHISRNISKAVQITAVSSPSETNGYIQFVANDSNTYRYDIGESNYVEFGPQPGTLSNLAGPVSSLTFTCYDACALDNPLSPVTDVNIIRTVRVDTTIINSGSLGQDKTFTAWAYLRTNAQGSDCWQNEDIGDVGAAGGATESDGYWTINASGADIWNYTDEFHYVYQSLSGDGQIIARVVSVEYTNSWAKAGVMIRETLDGDSKHAMMVVTPGNGTAFQRRTTTGGSSDHTPGSAVTAPYWVKLVRSGNTFTGYESADGGTWTLVGSVSITMAADVYIGLCVTSHSDGDICTAEIDNVGFSTVTYEGFTEAKDDSDAISITLSTSGSADAVNILGSWVAGLTHTVETGTDRALVFTAHAERGGTTSLTSVTYGGQAMTKVVEVVNSSGTTRTYTAAFILDEAGIAAATTSTFNTTWSITPTSAGYASVFLQNVNQTTLTGATASNQVASGRTITTSALSTDDGDMVIVASTCSSTGSYTVNNGFTEPLELTITNADGVVGYKVATGADETPSVRHSTNNSRKSLIGFVAKVNAAISGIGGNLLIAAIATDGSTTISEPSGWTEIDQGSFSGAVTLGAWYKIAETSEPAYHTFNWSGGQQAYGWIMQFTGHNTTTPINAYSTYGQSSISPTSPDVNTTVDNCLILRLGAFDEDDIVVGSTGLSGHTTITMNKSADSLVILLQDDFETDFSSWTDGGTTDWDLTTSQYVSYNHSAHCGNTQNDLISDDLDTSGYSSIRIEFWYRDDDIDSGEALLQLYDGTTYDNYADLGNDSEDTWHKYDVTINNSGGDAQYFINNFRIKFEGTSLDNGENLWIDDVTVTVTLDGTVSGGAGYVGQAISGNSGTSNFSLTSSNASQMLTIAIAPADTNDCDGTIRP